MDISRRRFIRNAGVVSIATPLVSSPVMALSQATQAGVLKVHLFSKHLQFMDVQEAGQIAAELGFDGLDLTVRPHGHILPENVKTDLPIAIKDLQKSGLSCHMITTAITDVNNACDVEIIRVAAEEGVKFYRSNWFKYHKEKTMQESLHFYQKKIRELGEVNKKHGVVGCYQNHAGTAIGSSYWEIKELLKTVDAKYFGTQYDIRHAMVEGGLSWPNGLRLLKDHIKTMVLKDVKWGRVNGKWKLVNVPIGEGMVDFNTYFKSLKEDGLQPPVSLHLEYPLGGAESGSRTISVDKKVIFDAMRKDLTAVHKLWRQA
ncbi:sugar phosphate isomerase/epimerase family protein [Saccharicrinis fermentans]|uniref:L-xylulose 5-phosphate 3-epimerase n=1 Tax=Saccharicrinis fermentans DSM 9555 = JCM 21142 TaxID=869213 RepID=W7Y5D9_9BACT|nr:sugar phosphate isomerase/epimerase family protein [Saccharicrinis fermentans]GAF03307.1 L-xylulose 5-phosphate 3-epimerase [Saccharicrinis fermentans DSM 9555 = JCM 21142]